jgi:hypothetical protein
MCFRFFFCVCEGIVLYVPWNVCVCLNQPLSIIRPFLIFEPVKVKVTSDSPSSTHTPLLLSPTPLHPARHGSRVSGIFSNPPSTGFAFHTISTSLFQRLGLARRTRTHPFALRIISPVVSNLFLYSFFFPSACSLHLPRKVPSPSALAPKCHPFPRRGIKVVGQLGRQNPIA